MANFLTAMRRLAGREFLVPVLKAFGLFVLVVGSVSIVGTVGYYLDDFERMVAFFALLAIFAPFIVYQRRKKKLKQASSSEHEEC